MTLLDGIRSWLGIWSKKVPLECGTYWAKGTGDTDAEAILVEIVPRTTPQGPIDSVYYGNKMIRAFDVIGGEGHESFERRPLRDLDGCLWRKVTRKGQNHAEVR